MTTNIPEAFVVGITPHADPPAAEKAERERTAAPTTEEDE